MKYISFFLIVLLFSCNQKKENNDFIEDFEVLFLKSKSIGDDLEMKMNIPDTTLSYRFIYLGKLTADGKDYKLLHKSVLNGYSSPHLESALILYDSSFKKVGGYYTSGFNISVLKGNIFSFSSMDNSSKQFKDVDFSAGIPEEIFIPCNNNLGDMINFTREK
ncbi:MAG TPA: hypothetical protein DIT10_19980 [Chryseobacterium sp.]|nr:hypothetical protein [Chryseobacterium sp.]